MLVNKSDKNLHLLYSQNVLTYTLMSIVRCVPPGDHHHLFVHSGPTTVVHGVPDPAGAHVEEEAFWTLSAYSE